MTERDERAMTAMASITVNGVAIGYADSGGLGPCVVLLHGAMMDQTLWSRVVDVLAPGMRCVVPLLPLGAHRMPVPPRTDLSPRGLAGLVAGFLAALELRDVTLVGNDTGGAIAQLVVTSRPDRVAALVLVSCDAFDNFPPGLPGRTMAALCRVPGGMYAAALSLRIPALRRLPMTFGWMTRRAGDGVVRGWADAFLAHPEVRRDTARMMRAVTGQELISAAERLPGFDRPALVIWAAGDKVMPLAHADRLAQLLPQAKEPVLIEDSYTLVPLDQPGRLAEALQEFVRKTE
jgi:pimeloyl-ACP methyl ester carboxylesterase